MQKATATRKMEGAANRKRKADAGKQRTEVTVFDSALFGPKPLKMQVRFKAKYYDVEVYSRIADSSCVVYYTASGCYEGLDSVFLWDAKRRQLTGDDGELIDTRKKPKASKTTGSPKTPNGVLKKDAGVAPAPIDTRAIPKKTSTVGAPPRPLPLFEQGDRVELQSGGDAGDHIITSISAGKRKCTITPLTGGEPLQVLTSQLLPVETEVVVVAECVRVFPGLFREFKHIKTSTVIEALDAASMVESAAKTILLRQQNELDLAGGADVPGGAASYSCGPAGGGGKGSAALQRLKQDKEDAEEAKRCKQQLQSSPRSVFESPSSYSLARSTFRRRSEPDRFVASPANRQVSTALAPDF
jgi:hypothetical protein